MVTIGLSEHERAVLRRLAADLDRQAPGLGRRLAEFGPPDDGGPAVSWRPPKAAVVMAAVMLAGAGFMVTALSMVMSRSCSDTAADVRVTAEATAVPRPPAAVPPPAPPAREPAARPVPPEASPPSAC